MQTSIAEVYESTLKLIAPLTQEETYQTILAEAQKLANAKYGSIFIYTHGKLVRTFSTVPHAEQLEPRKNGYTYTAFAQKKTLVIPISTIKHAHPEFHNDQTKKMILIPLSFGSDSLGVLTLDSAQKKGFTKQRLEILKLFGSLASIKIRNVTLLKELEGSVQTRDLFISMASHELKTPLTTISAYAQLIEQSLVNHKEIKSLWVNTLKVASGRMTRLINELLHVNQIRTGTLVYNFKEVDVAAVIKQAMIDFSFSYPKQLIKFENLSDKSKVTIWADRDKLVQVFINLMNNAAKFSQDDKEIVVSLEKIGSKILVSVKDQGLGIQPEDLQHLFEEFYKAKTNTKEGMGLGLFISKKIVEAHKGKISITSQLGVGTQVAITLKAVAYES